MDGTQALPLEPRTRQSIEDREEAMTDRFPNCAGRKDATRPGIEEQARLTGSKKGEHGRHYEQGRTESEDTRARGQKRRKRRLEETLSKDRAYSAGRGRS